MDYKEEIWSLNPFGSKVDFTSRFDYCVMEGNKPDKIYFAYKEYLSWWNINYGGRDEKYIGDKNKKMSPSDFITTNSFNKSWKTSDSLSSYLKLDVVDPSVINKSYQNFLKKHNIK